MVAEAPVRVMLIFFSFSLCYLAMDPWHNWGGDYAYYLGVARNIHFDRPLETANVGVVAPTGFSWFLSRIAPLVDWQFLPLKRVNLIWVAIYSGAVLQLSRCFAASGWRVAFVALATINFGIWYYSNQILTELMFLAIVACFFLILVQRPNRRIWASLVALFFLALLACSIRQAALLLLLVPPFFFLDTDTRNTALKRGLVFLGILGLSITLAISVYQAGWFHAAAHSQLAGDDQGALAKVLSIISRYDSELSAFAAGLAGDVRNAWFGMLVLSLVILATALRILQGNFAVAAFMVALAAPILYVPWSPPDGRYWFPLLAPASFLVTEALIYLVRVARLNHFRSASVPFLAFFLAVLSWHHLGTTNRVFLFDRDRGVFEGNAANLFHWLHYNTEWGARVCFFKPRILGYHANWNNVCLIAQNSTPADVEATLETAGDFVVVSDQYLPATWEHYRDLDDPRIVYRNERFVVIGREPVEL